MQVQCAWCKRPMGEKMGPEGLVTHGICPDCAAEIDAKIPLCPVHGHYFPVPSRFDGHPVCEKCERESFPTWYLDGSPTLAEVNFRRGFESDPTTPVERRPLHGFGAAYKDGLD